MQNGEANRRQVFRLRIKINNHLWMQKPGNKNLHERLISPLRSKRDAFHRHENISKRSIANKFCSINPQRFHQSFHVNTILISDLSTMDPANFQYGNREGSNVVVSFGSNCNQVTEFQTPVLARTSHAKLRLSTCCATFVRVYRLRESILQVPIEGITHYAGEQQRSLLLCKWV